MIYLLGELAAASRRVALARFVKMRPKGYYSAGLIYAISAEYFRADYYAAHFHGPIIFRRANYWRRH